MKLCSLLISALIFNTLSCMEKSSTKKIQEADLIQQMFEIHQFKCQEESKKASNNAKKLELLITTMDFSNANIDDFQKQIYALHWAKISLLNNFSFRGIKSFRITKLSLDNNKLKGNLPEGLKELQDLEEISLASNRLKEIPEIIIAFPKLKILNLAHNKISSIKQVGNKKLDELNLVKFDLTDNYVSDLPFELIEDSSEGSQDVVGDGKAKRKKMIITIAQNPIVQSLINQVTAGQPFFNIFFPCVPWKIFLIHQMKKKK